MSEPITDVPPYLETQCLVDAVAELVTRDLDLLFTKRRLQVRNAPEGPLRDATIATNNIAYLSSRLLRQTLDYYRSMAQYWEQQFSQVMEDFDDEVPW